jgi:hypothetical protein
LGEPKAENIVSLGCVVTNGEKIEFKVFDALKLPQDNLDCFNVCEIQTAVEEVFQVHHIDPLEATLTHSFKMHDIELDFEDVTHDIIEAHSSKYAPLYEMLEQTNNNLVPSIVHAPVLLLKQLPAHLKYAYLGGN